MSVIATCGHKLTEQEGLGTTISVKDTDREGNKSISHITVCDKCYDVYKVTNQILYTEEQEDVYLYCTSHPYPADLDIVSNKPQTDLSFTHWLLENTTIKQVLFTNGIRYFWTLNTDYEHSWDGEDVKRYSSEEIFKIYKNNQ